MHIRFVLSLFSMALIFGLHAQTARKYSNAFLEIGVDARAMGMGNAFAAVADDYTATYWNPAGLTMLKQSELSADIYHLKYQNEATYLGQTILDERASRLFLSSKLSRMNR